jgi:ERCC4-type nuclease
MNIIVDTREPALYDKLLAENREGSIFTIVMKPLVLGDIALEMKETGELLVLFERKSLSDLLSSIKDGRYVEQSHRLIHTSRMHPHNIVYIIEGMFSQLRTPLDRRICLSAITSLSYYKGFSVIRTCSISETAEWIFAMSSKIHKERTKGNIPAYRNPTPMSEPTTDTPTTGTSTTESLSNTLENTHISSSTPNVVPYCEVVHKVKKDNITPENIGEIILCTIPGISSTSAVEIMKQYTSFSHFMKEIESRPESLQEIYLTSNGKKRKLGKNIIENILRFLSPPPMSSKVISP